MITGKYKDTEVEVVYVSADLVYLLITKEINDRKHKFKVDREEVEGVKDAELKKLRSQIEKEYKGSQ